jgi:hypothetical protein
MSLTKAQCASALFNRMRIGAQTQLRRRIMENNHGFAYGESNSSAVKWSVSELESDLKTDEKILSSTATTTAAAENREKASLSLDDHLQIQKNKLLFTRTKDDVVNEMKKDVDVYTLDRDAAMVAFDDADENALFAEDGEDPDDNGLDEDESNWLDNIGKLVFSIFLLLVDLLFLLFCLLLCTAHKLYCTCTVLTHVLLNSVTLLLLLLLLLLRFCYMLQQVSKVRQKQMLNT